MDISQTALLEVKCQSCKNTFSAVMYVGDKTDYNESTFAGSEAQCPECGSTNILSKNNISIAPSTY